MANKSKMFSMAYYEEALVDGVEDDGAAAVAKDDEAPDVVVVVAEGQCELFERVFEGIFSRKISHHKSHKQTFAVSEVKSK